MNTTHLHDFGTLTDEEYEFPSVLDAAVLLAQDAGYRVAGAWDLADGQHYCPDIDEERPEDYECCHLDEENPTVYAPGDDSILVTVLDQFGQKRGTVGVYIYDNYPAWRCRVCGRPPEQN